MTKTDILDTIDAVLAENRQVKQRRMQAHVLWLLDNPTQLPIKGLSWDESTTAITNSDLDENAYVADQLWRFNEPGDPRHLCVRCTLEWVEGDQPWCSDNCEPCGWDHSMDETSLARHLGVNDIAQPIHRGRVHVRSMVESR